MNRVRASRGFESGSRRGGRLLFFFQQLNTGESRLESGETQPAQQQDGDANRVDCRRGREAAHVVTGEVFHQDFKF